MLRVAETQDELLAGFASVAGQSFDALGGHGQVEAAFFAGQLDQADTVAKAGHQRQGFVVPVLGDVAEQGEETAQGWQTRLGKAAPVG